MRCSHHITNRGVMFQDRNAHRSNCRSAGANELALAPDWLVGLWRRRSIELEDGTVDQSSRVFWAQTLNLFVDIRIPISRPNPAGCRGFRDFTIDQLSELCEQHAFAGHVVLKDETCTWVRLIDFQPPTGRPDTGRLILDGDILHEFGGANTVMGLEYHETYHRDTDGKEKRVALRLESCNGRLLGGRSPGDAILVVLDDRFVFARGRSRPLSPAETLREVVASADGDRAAIEDYLDCEISMGLLGSDARHWQIELSTLPWREGQRLFPRGQASAVSQEGVLQVDTPVGSARWLVYDTNLRYEVIRTLMSL